MSESAKTLAVSRALDAVERALGQPKFGHHHTCTDDYGRVLNCLIDRDFTRVMAGKFSDGTPIPLVFFTAQAQEEILDSAYREYRRECREGAHMTIDTEKARMIMNQNLTELEETIHALAKALTFHQLTLEQYELVDRLLREKREEYDKLAERYIKEAS